MRKRIAAALLVCLLPIVTGCSPLLERSYGTVEPYADRYWDATAEDTLRAETYQDMVTSLLLLVDQRAEEGVIRYYGKEEPYAKAMEARKEVLEKTTAGSYLVNNIYFSSKVEPDCQVFTFHLSYRAGTQDIEDIITISNSQSLLDLLRLAVRERHQTVTARFAYEVRREEVSAVVENFWEQIFFMPAVPGSQTEDSLLDIPPYKEPARPVFCPWELYFYPQTDMVSMIEIKLY